MSSNNNTQGAGVSANATFKEFFEAYDALSSKMRAVYENLPFCMDPRDIQRALKEGLSEDTVIYLLKEACAEKARLDHTIVWNHK